MPDQPSPDGTADWGAFPNTILRFGSVPPVTIDLRDPIDDTIRSTLRTIGFERSFGVISGQDPMGERQSDAVNERLAVSLQTDVARLRAAQSRVTAYSPYDSHSEASIAIAIDLNPLIDLANRYDQLAIFWFDGDAFWIVPARSNNAKLKLPVRT